MINTIRAKLTLWFIAVFAVALLAFAGVIYSAVIAAIENETDENLAEIAQSLFASIYSEMSRGEHEVPEERMVEQVIDYRFRDYEYAFFTGDGRLISTTFSVPLPENLASQSTNYSRATVGDEEYRVFQLPFIVDEQNYKVFVMTSLREQAAVERQIGRLFLIIGPIQLLLAGIGGFLLARQSLRPIAEMGARATRISAANLHERLPIEDERDEVGRLATLFNDLLNRLENEFERQRRFMADASHELRTPIAIIQGESEVTLAKEDRSSAEYREVLGVVNDESKRLSRIVQDLFTLARADSGEIRFEPRDLYLDELIGECIRAVRTLADKCSITIEFESSEMPVVGDEALLKRLFLNLLDNAVKYNVEGGSIKVVAHGNTVRVSNTGPEIPEAKRHMIFERFYRVEKARSRRAETITSGAGLGLSIAKWIADLHDAELKYSSDRPGENTFVVIFPR